MFDDRITLIKDEIVISDRGVPTTLRTRVNVYAQVSSVGGSEFFDAGQNGIRPAYQFIVYDVEYDNQQDVEYKGTMYRVYRTYRRSKDKIELYVEKRTGVNGGDLSGNNS